MFPVFNMNDMNNMNMNMNMNDMNMNYMNYMNNMNMNMNNINPAMVNAFLNMMMMNQNIMNNNQMDLNNMVNPSIFQMNQQNNNNFNRFQVSRNQNEQSIIQNGGVLPRANGVNNNNKVKKEDIFPGYIGPRLNIIFETGAGHIFNFPTPLNVTVSQLLHKFIGKVGVSDSLLGKKIFFIFNGKTIPINESRSVEAYFKEESIGASNQTKIVVIDGNNVIGALNHGIYNYS